MASASLPRRLLRDRMSGCAKLEHRDLGSDIEAHVQDMTHSAIDVQTPIAGEREFAGGVPPVTDGEQRRRQKGWLALSAMRMSRQNPPFVAAPHRPVNGVGIMAEHNGRPVGIEPFKNGFWFELSRPHVVESQNLQPLDIMNGI